MNFILILPYYLYWHYTSAFKDLTSVWKNLISFVYNFFSIGVLLETLFSPWMRINDGYKGADSIVNTFVFNSLMRVFGVFVRLIFIVFGILSLTLTLLLGVAMFAVWLFMPVLLLSLFAWSLSHLTK